MLRKILICSVPVGLFVWTILEPGKGGLAFIGIYATFQALVLLLDTIRPIPDPTIWKPDETVVLRRYHLALRYPSGARTVSNLLKVFRWTVIFMAPLLLWHRMWLEGGILVVGFFFPRLSSLVVRLDPFFYLGESVFKGDRRVEYELTLLERVSKKYDRYLDAPHAVLTHPTLEDAVKANERGDYNNALLILKPYVEKGYAQALTLQGDMYRAGHGPPNKHADAAKLYRKAADQGSVDAQRKLGDIYYSGDGIPKDLVQAAKWYRKAAEAGDAEAQFKLGGMSFDKQTKVLFKGDRPDITETLQWYLMAAEQGHAEAQYSLGILYSGDMFGVQDYVKAYKWLNIAALRFPESSPNARERAQKGRDSMADMLTRQQLAEARKLVRVWKPTKAGNRAGKNVSKKPA